MAFLLTLDMGLLQPYIDRLQKASNNLERVAIQAVREKEDFILSYLKHEQLGEGMDSFGRIVGNYAAKTEEVFAKMSPKPRTAKNFGEPYNFEWTGKFFDGMKVKTTKEGFDITSPSKTDLERIYDTKLTAFTKENMEFIRLKVIEPALYGYIFEQATKL